MSKISDMLNGKKKFVSIKTNDDSEELNKAFERLRGLIQSGLVDLANGLADELEKDEEKIAEEAVEDADKNTSEEFEKNAKNAGWSCKPTEKEMVSHPSHYQGKRFEVIDIIEDYELNFNKGNALKYLIRAGHKDDYVQDLKKAIWYLNREIETYNSGKGL